MSQPTLFQLLTCACAAGVVGCGGYRPSGSTPGADGAGGAGITIGAEALASYSGDLVSLMKDRIANLEVHRRAGQCPDLSLRGRKSVTISNPPGIYVDGQQALDTCILEQLSPRRVEHMEIYPMGVTHRPGYSSSSGGLVLIFLKDGIS
jgi:hypothetical protein